MSTGQLMRSVATKRSSAGSPELGFVRTCSPLMGRSLPGSTNREAPERYLARSRISPWSFASSTSKEVHSE